MVTTVTARRCGSPPGRPAGAAPCSSVPYWTVPSASAHNAPSRRSPRQPTSSPYQGSCAAWKAACPSLSAGVAPWAMLGVRLRIGAEEDSAWREVGWAGLVQRNSVAGLRRVCVVGRALAGGQRGRLATRRRQLVHRAEVAQVAVQLVAQAAQLLALTEQVLANEGL